MRVLTIGMCRRANTAALSSIFARARTSRERIAGTRCPKPELRFRIRRNPRTRVGNRSSGLGHRVPAIRSRDVRALAKIELLEHDVPNQNSDSEYAGTRVLV